MAQASCLFSVAHAGQSGSHVAPIKKWTGMSVARRLFRFGRPACVFQHLCPKKWSPVRESHPPARFCRPLPRLLGQRDEGSLLTRAMIRPRQVVQRYFRGACARPQLVVPAGNAPASSGYQPGALLLSYETSSSCGFKPNCRIGRKLILGFAIGRMRMRRFGL
jgi:hypothetical protein